jgi:signal transduction histidine kinase
MFDYSMAAKKITKHLVINTQGLRLKFYTDMRLYESIAFHILSNAVKFSPAGSVVTVEIEL